MTTYILDGAPPAPNPVAITDRHFGINVVTVYDQELTDPGEPAADLLARLGPSTLRFPGGSATELYFDMTHPNAVVSADPDAPALTPMDGFLSVAAATGADVALVIPTRVAFTQSATEAMLSGTYGSRDTLRADYLAEVTAFVETAFQTAASAGTQITTLELGNEFWGSGQMTAAEYGIVAARLAVHLDALLTSLGRQDVAIIVQSTSAASQVFSPRGDTPFQIDGIDITIPAQGSAADQLEEIAQALTDLPGAVSAIDGVVAHYYQKHGFDGADGGQSFALTQMIDFGEMIGRSDLEFHVTEWNVKGGDYPDNSGLQQAAMMAETFFEMLRHGVSDAQIWPLSFNNAQGTALTTPAEARLSIAGEMFRLMRESLPGLTPAVDWSIDGVVDLHGYSSEARTAFFLSERSGSPQSFQLDARAALTESRYFVTMTELWDGGAGGNVANAPPVLSEVDGRTLSPHALELSLAAWANLRIEATEVGWRDDHVTGRGGHDRIYTYGGDDTVQAGDGHDYANGGNGDDWLDGGDGNDWLEGSAGADILIGGAGADCFVFTSGDGADRILDLVLGEDDIRINGERAVGHGGLARIDGATLTRNGDVIEIGYGTGDVIFLDGAAPPRASAPDGRIVGTHLADALIGGAGQDDLRGHSGGDYLEDGAGRDFLRGGNGADVFVLHRDGALDTITDFLPGKDVIDLTRWGVDAFSDLAFEVERDAGGAWTGRGLLRWQDETVQLEGFDGILLARVTPSDFLL